ncbi:MAG: acetylornithine carbamoyltransferase [Cyclobacteriaceae bacterium]|nr:acetylornithine carbamoyltransferase [Cytophagales bacterium]MCZ8328342.1 acetylornithine carbamoyltransferase [Cyclobacteriaceae bacterium]
MKQFISVEDVPDIQHLVNKALAYKINPYLHSTLGNKKRMGLLFLNPSMRTRLSMQVAAQQLGVEVVVFNVGQDGWALEFEEGAIMQGHTVEHIKDAAPILGKYFDVIGVRTFPGLHNKEEDYAEFYLQQIIRYAGVPIISLESATLHPLQSLTDIITIQEHFKEKRKPKIVLTWAPHIKALPQCVANSFAQWITQWNQADFVITHPEGYELAENFTKGAIITHSQTEALQDADFVYVKNWSAYREYGKVLGNHSNWMLTMDKLQHTNNAKIMHCLPVRRNIEISDEVLDSQRSLVTEQAANRVWAAQAVLSEILTASSHE